LIIGFKGREIAVGFSNGIVRFLLINPIGMFLLKAFKVHRTAITHISFSPDGQVLSLLIKEVIECGNSF